MASYLGKIPEIPKLPSLLALPDMAMGTGDTAAYQKALMQRRPQGIADLILSRNVGPKPQAGKPGAGAGARPGGRGRMDEMVALARQMAGRGGAFAGIGAGAKPDIKGFAKSVREDVGKMRTLATGY